MALVLPGAGGLALFLYGMRMMSEGLSKAVGNRLESGLAKWTYTAGRAWLLGVVVTAVVQSSSAVTVMVIGLVGAGVIELRQAAGIIMGANVGTTVTAWMLSLAGIHSAPAFVRAWNLTSLASVSAVVGVALLFLSEGERFRHIVLSLEGFAILMFGMDAMCESAKRMTEVSGFAETLARVSNPFSGMLAGAALTAVVQSSSASVGMLQALCATGAVSYGSAIPIIMGQNVGTCATALLAGAGGRDAARSAARIHLYFNVVGALLFMPLFCTAKYMTHASFLERPASAAGIAFLHSAFNIATTLALMPFLRWLVRAAAEGRGPSRRRGVVRVGEAVPGHDIV